MAHQFTKEEIRSCIKIRNGENAGSWVLLLAKDGHTYDMSDAFEDFGKIGIGAFATKECALRYYLDNKLYEKVYHEYQLEAQRLQFEGCYDDATPLENYRSVMSDCEDYSVFYIELVPAVTAEAKADDADIVASSGIDFSQTEEYDFMSWEGNLSL